MPSQKENPGGLGRRGSSLSLKLDSRYAIIKERCRDGYAKPPK
jgi:hypothetical protein